MHEIAAAPMATSALIDAALDEASPAARDWLEQLRDALSLSSRQASARIQELGEVAMQCRKLADMDFSLMYSPSRDLFATGYNVNERRA